jgi:hypothetical protein
VIPCAARPWEIQLPHIRQNEMRTHLFLSFVNRSVPDQVGRRPALGRVNRNKRMPEKTFKEIPPCWRELYQRGEAAAQRLNWDYASEIFHQVLQQEPAFYDCRQALRRTQFQKSSAGQGRFRKLLGTVTSSPRVAQARLLMRGNPLRQINVAESVLNRGRIRISPERIGIVPGYFEGQAGPGIDRTQSGVPRLRE